MIDRYIGQEGSEIMLGKWSATGIVILNNMNHHYGAMSKAMLRISSGYRINSAADDPAGLAISEKMRAQIRGLNMAAKNIQDGISLVQTAEGALNETHAMIQRMRELAVEAANDTLTDDDRKKLDLEFQELKKEIQRTSTIQNLIRRHYSMGIMKQMALRFKQAQMQGKI